LETGIVDQAVGIDVPGLVVLRHQASPLINQLESTVTLVASALDGELDPGSYEASNDAGP